MNVSMSEAPVDLSQLMLSVQGVRHVGRGPLMYQGVIHHFQFVDLILEPEG